jgi:hypothetical protein
MHSVIEQIKTVATTSRRQALASIAEFRSIVEQEEVMLHDVAEVFRSGWDTLRGGQPQEGAVRSTHESAGQFLLRHLNGSVQLFSAA